MIRLFRVFIPTSIVALLVSETILILLSFLAATVLILPEDFDIFLLYEQGLPGILSIAGVLVLTMYYQDMYTTDLRVRSKTLLFQRIIFCVGVALLLEAMLAYVNRDLLLPRRIMLLGCILTILVLSTWRIMYGRGIFRALGSRRILFLGTSAVALDAAECMARSPQLGFTNVGFLDDTHPPGTRLHGAEVLGKVEDLRPVVNKHRPDSIVVGLTERRRILPVMDLLDMRFQGVRIQEAAALYEVVFGRIPIRELRPAQLIYTAELGPQQSSMRLQHAYSTVIAIVAFLLTLPLMLIVALLVKLSSPGPVLFRQKRVGLNGRVFTLYKFRSMVTDAEAHTGAVWAKRDDPRTTAVGKYLRRLRLDELPQLLNVIRGEMSLVGPRPERPEFVQMLSEQIPFYRQRHAVRPGITGWAQINYKYGETLEDTVIKLEYDLYYIKNLSVSLDLYIMFQTAKVMLFTRSGH